MASEISNKSSNHKSESALAAASDSILQGLTTPIELFTHSENYKQSQKTAKDLADFRENARDYLKEGLKTAAMFMRGKTGLITTIATQALDEWKPADKKHELIDLGLGATKGAALTYVFRKTAMVDAEIKFFGSTANIGLNAAKLGFLSRIPSVGLSRSTWLDENDKFDANRTGSIVAASTASIGTDVVAGFVTHGLLKGANRVTGDAVAKSPMLSTMLTGSGFGMSNGAAQEIFRQQEKQENFDPLKLDYWKIGQSALLQGAIDSVAAIPGGHQAEHEALRSFNRMNAGAPKVTKVPSFKRELRKSSELESGNESSSHDSCSMCLTKADLDSTTITYALDQSTNDKFSRFDKQIQSNRSKQHYDAKKDTVELTTDNFVVYFPKDHNLIIGVPAKYNDILKQVREQRIIEEAGGEFDYSRQNLKHLLLGMHHRALPEDLIPCLDALPNSLLIKSIYLHNEQRAWDLKKGRPGKFGYAVADANTEGHLNYYMHQDREALLRFTTNHEFGHLVHFKFDEVQVAYESACKLENAIADKTVNARDYATKNTNENFAVHFGEELLDPSPQRLISATNYAPLRMAILTKALKATLTEIPQAKVSLHRDQFLTRAELLEEKFIPQVIDELMNNLQKRDTYENPGIFNHRLQVLAYIGQHKHAQKLLKIASTVTDPETAIVLLDAGYRMCKNDRKSQLDFLKKMSDKVPFENVRDLSIRKFDQETLVDLDAQIDNFQNKYEYDKAEECMREATDMSKRIYGELSFETRDQLDRLGGFYLSEGRYNEALPLLIRRHQIDKNISDVLDWQQIKFGLEDILTCCEGLGLDKANAFFLEQMDIADTHI